MTLPSVSQGTGPALSSAAWHAVLTQAYALLCEQTGHPGATQLRTSFMRAALDMEWGLELGMCSGLLNLAKGGAQAKVLVDHVLQAEDCWFDQDGLLSKHIIVQRMVKAVPSLSKLQLSDIEIEFDAQPNTSMGEISSSVHMLAKLALGSALASWQASQLESVNPTSSGPRPIARM